MKKWLLAFVTILTTLSSMGGPSAPPAGAEALAAEEVGSWPMPGSSGKAKGIKQTGIPARVHAQDESWWEQNWAMAGANPQRTSWVANSVPSTEYLQLNRQVYNNGMLYPDWFKPIEPYIPPKAQIVAAYDTLYVSTARGLYAIDAAAGTEKWVYATEMPLGHSPTIYDGVAYVGGFDHKIHAINARTGQALWTFEAGSNSSDELGAGFDTNPLVVGDKLFAGNRNGWMYAVYISGPSTGQLAWKFKTGDQIHYSAAYKDGVIYFASDDNCAYALDIDSGSLVWKSEQLPGQGFHSWWPVVYEDPESGADVVIFSGSYLYRSFLPPRRGTDLHLLEWQDIFPVEDPNLPDDDPYAGSYRSPMASDGWIDTTQTTYFGSDPVMTNSDYFEQKPWRRTYFVLDRQTGQEITYDFDHDGSPEYAPILWFGTHDGNRYPPVVGGFDRLLYQSNMYQYRGWIQGGQVSAWEIGTPNIRVSTPDTIAMDEPLAYSAAGNLIYWTHCCDRSAGAFDTSVPLDTPASARTWAWLYFNYNIHSVFPEYDPMYTEPYRLNDWPGVYGTENGVYSGHVGDQNPPVPYNGRVYIHRSNTILAFSMEDSGLDALPMAPKPVTPPTSISAPSVSVLTQRLTDEVQAVINSGHLRPGWGKAGLFEHQSYSSCGENLLDYWHHPSDTLHVLSLAYPYLEVGLQEQVSAFLDGEFSSLPPYVYTHIGWQSGNNRDNHGLVPEDEAEALSSGPSASYGSFWGDSGSQPNYPPHMFYGMWQYARIAANPQQVAQQILAKSGGRLLAPPYDKFAEYPFVLNSHIAGRIGYLELQKLAGQTENQTIKQELNDLLQLRAATFSKDTFYSGTHDAQHMYCRTLSVARNFMFVVPELADYLHTHALAPVREAVDEYSWVAPYWFVGEFEATTGEGTFKPYYEPIAMFQAKALILKEPYDELAKYLDAPSFVTGDLFFIQNLVTAIEAASTGPSPTFTDVPFSHPYHDTIEALYQAGYTAGCNTNPLMYCPENTMNRAESAVFVERGIHGTTGLPPQPTIQTFADLPLDSWAAKWAEALWQDHYTAGCGTDPLIYCPWQGHTRAEGCVFYLHMLNGPTYEPPQPSQQTFADVPLEAWYAKWVQAGYDAGLLEPCQTSPELRFCPDDPLSRALAAYMMVQAKGLQSH